VQSNSNRHIGEFQACWPYILTLYSELDCTDVPRLLHSFEVSNSANLECQVCPMSGLCLAFCRRLPPAARPPGPIGPIESLGAPGARNKPDIRFSWHVGRADKLLRAPLVPNWHCTKLALACLFQLLLFICLASLVEKSHVLVELCNGTLHNNLGGVYRARRRNNLGVRTPP